MTQRRVLALALAAAVIAVGGGASAGATTARKVKVPNVVGLAKATALTRVRAAKLRAHDVAVKSLRPVGTVVAEKPRAGAKVAIGTRVDLSISHGPGP